MPIIEGHRLPVESDGQIEQETASLTECSEAFATSTTGSKANNLAVGVILFLIDLQKILYALIVIVKPAYEGAMKGFVQTHK